MSIHLQRFGVLADDQYNENTHVFTFVFENPYKLVSGEVKSIESSECTYCGQKWSIVVMKKEEYMGVYLKWKYSDAPSLPYVSVKLKYILGLVNRSDYGLNKHFSTTQKFRIGQTVLGRSKFITFRDLLDIGKGFLDHTGKRLVMELTLSNCSLTFTKSIDISSGARTKKNTNGYYFDTPTFVAYSNRWYLRIYPSKLNSNGLPASYLYLATKSKGLVLETKFRLYLESESSEILFYSYGHGARFDGFGRTLNNILPVNQKMETISVGIEILQLNVTKDLQLPIETLSKHQDPAISAEPFQDIDGNLWRLFINHSFRYLTCQLDKGVHHYQQNKTKLLCWKATLRSQIQQKFKDVEMLGDCITGYFSNFLDECGLLASFPIETSELKDQSNAFTDSGNVIIRISMISIQTLPIAMKSYPKFDYQSKQLIRARQSVMEKNRRLEDMKELSASQVSLGDLNSTCSKDGSAVGSFMDLYDMDNGLQNKQMEKNIDSSVNAQQLEMAKVFCKNLITYQTANVNGNNKLVDKEFSRTRKDIGSFKDDATESGLGSDLSFHDDVVPSQHDLTRQRDVITAVIQFLQEKLPLDITEIVQLGSIGADCVTKSRADVDLIIFSTDLPKFGQESWMTPIIQATKELLHYSNQNVDPYRPLPKCSEIKTSASTVQFTCSGIDIDIFYSYDWEKGSTYSELYKWTCLETSKFKKYWFSIGSARLQRKFINEQKKEVKDVIKILKHWRNSIQWRKTKYRPDSYLISLLVIKACEETKSTDLTKVATKVGQYIFNPETSIMWSKYYLPGKFEVDFEPPYPLIQDPANPGINVADSLSYWGQFKAEMKELLHSLNVPFHNMLS